MNRELSLLSHKSKPVERALYWRQNELRRKAWEKSIKKRSEAEFKRQEKLIAKTYRELLKDERDLAGITEGLRVALETFWTEFLTKAYLDIMQDFGTRSGQEVVRAAEKVMAEKTFRGSIGSTGSTGELTSMLENSLEPVTQFKAWGFDVWGEGVQKWVACNAGDKIKGISNTSLSLIQREICAGMAEGETVDELARRVGTASAGFTERRATVIARTEVVCASNAGSFFAAEQTGLPMKKVWLATPDERTRDTHLDADGQAVELQENFNIHGYELKFPGDSTLGAPPQEVIQCRCTQTYELPKQNLVLPVEPEHASLVPAPEMFIDTLADAKNHKGIRKKEWQGLLDASEKLKDDLKKAKLYTAVQSYTEKDFYTINKYLRDPRKVKLSSEEKQTLSKVEKAIDEYPSAVPRNCTLYRGLDKEGFANGLAAKDKVLQKTFADVFDGLEGQRYPVTAAQTEDAFKELKTQLVGRCYVDKSFISASCAKGTAEDFGDMAYEILVDRDTKGILFPGVVSKFPQEQEAIFQRNTEFEIVDLVLRKSKPDATDGALTLRVKPVSK